MEFYSLTTVLGGILLMFLNNDLLFVAGSIIVAGIFTISIYNSIFTSFPVTSGTSESLVNTSIIAPPSENTNPIPVQDPTPLQVPGANIIQLDVGVQTSHTGLWQTFKDWVRETFSVNSENCIEFNHDAVDNWLSDLDSMQSVTLHDSESSLDNNQPLTNTTLDNLIMPKDSASQVPEVASPVSTFVKVYDMSDPHDVLDLMNDPCVVAFNSITEDGLELISFNTPDNSYEILRSTLEALLTSVN